MNDSTFYPNPSYNIHYPLTIVGLIPNSAFYPQFRVLSSFPCFIPFRVLSLFRSAIPFRYSIPPFRFRVLSQPHIVCRILAPFISCLINHMLACYVTAVKVRSHGATSRRDMLQGHVAGSNFIVCHRSKPCRGDKKMKKLSPRHAA